MLPGMNQQWIWQHPNWPAFTWNPAAVNATLAQARFAHGLILGAARLLDSELTRESLADLLVEDGVATSAIEGETLDPGAVRSSVARQLGLPFAGLPKPSRGVDGLVSVLLDATKNARAPLTRERVFGWHAALFPSGHSGIHEIRTGAWRGDAPMHVISGAHGRERIHFTAPPGEKVEQETRKFFTWFDAPPVNIDRLIVAGIAHLWFVTIHPFEDGNGRITRAITDMAIARDILDGPHLFSLSAQIMHERKGYYDILESTQRGDMDITPWLCWFLDRVEAAALASVESANTVLDRTRFWVRHSRTELNERQRKALNRMMVPGGFTGGMTSAKYVSLTRTSRATATRELADLVAKGCLKPTGAGGRSTAYWINTK